MPVKKTTKKKPAKKTVSSAATKKEEKKPLSTAKTTKRRTYSYAVGRRKEAIARVRLLSKITEKGIVVNGKPYEEYFTTDELRSIILAPLKTVGMKEWMVSVKVRGGGIRGQAESVRLGIARILVQLDAENRPALKAAGFLTRDPRVKERKKYGLKRARRAPQWKKR